MTTRFIPNPPPMMYLDGKAVEAEIAIRIFDGSIETTRIGYCSESRMNVLVFIDSYDSYKLSNG